MKKPKISVIIPVYNIEEYIEKCLESVNAQTYTDYEVIIVNDGSTDKSAEIVLSFIKDRHLSNWNLIDQENSGVAATRNVAMDLAKGEWLAFIDGDDWVESNYLESMWKMLEEHPVDLCYCGCRAYDQITGTFEVWSQYGDDVGELPKDIGKLYSFGYIWGHLYKKSIVEENNIRFDEHIFCEDSAFNLDYNSVINSFCMTGCVAYNYRINRSGSLVTKLVHPSKKRRLYDHMQTFLTAIDEDYLIKGMKQNPKLVRVLWNELHCSITNDILENQYKHALNRKKATLSKIVFKTYHARSRKEKLFLTFLKGPFFALVLLVKIYYSNYKKLRKGKFLKFISKGL